MKKFIFIVVILFSKTLLSYCQDNFDITKPDAVINLPKNIVLGKSDKEFKIKLTPACLENDSITFRIQLVTIDKSIMPANNVTIKLPIKPKQNLDNPIGNDMYGFVLIPIKDTVKNKIPKILIYGLGLATAPKPKPTPKEPLRINFLIDPLSPYFFDSGLMGIVNIDSATNKPGTVNIYGLGLATAPKPKPTPKERTIEIKENSSSLSLPFCNKKYEINFRMLPNQPIININTFKTLQ